MLSSFEGLGTCPGFLVYLLLTGRLRSVTPHLCYAYFSWVAAWACRASLTSGTGCPWISSYAEPGSSWSAASPGWSQSRPSSRPACIRYVPGYNPQTAPPCRTKNSAYSESRSYNKNKTLSARVFAGLLDTAPYALPHDITRKEFVHPARYHGREYHSSPAAFA